MKCGNLRDELMELVLNGAELATPGVREHIAVCPACAHEVATLRQTLELLDEWQSPEPSAYFSARMRARMREELVAQPVGWLAWLRRPAVVTAAAALMAVGVGLLEGARWKADHQPTLAGNSTQGTISVSAVNDLQYLDSHADLFADFDALDDSQTETN